MIVGNQASDSTQPVGAGDERHVVGVDGVTGNERQDFSSLIVHSQRPRRGIRTLREVFEKVMHSGRPRPRRPANRVTDAHHAGVGVPALEWLFEAAHRTIIALVRRAGPHQPSWRPSIGAIPHRPEYSLTKVRDMGGDQVESVRRFNRIVTERIGALHDDYLARARPLGESRVLWEVGVGATDARALRTRLGLDSGYLSRLLRSLESDGLVTVAPSDGDARVRAVSLTAAGRRERRVLDRRSDELAASLLAPLNAGQRDRLVDAVTTVERLLTAGLVDVGVEHPATAAARQCVGSYFAELDRRFDTGFDPAISNPADDGELTEPAGLLLVARLRGDPIGCGALKLHHDEPAEIKRMWVHASARGLGLGRRLLAELEQHAADRGVGVVRLETNRSLTEAVGLYRASGYVEVAAFNDEPFAHHWFEKRLGRRADD